MHEKHKTWKREIDFDLIKTATEMDEKLSRTSTSPAPDPFFYRNIVIPTRPHTPDEFTLEMNVDVEGLRMEIILSQPASSQCDPSPDVPWSIRGQRNPESRDGRPRSVQVKIRSIASRDANGGRFFHFEFSMDDFLRSNCRSTEQEYILLGQLDVGGDDEKEATSQQAAVREEFASPTEKRQQEGATAWATEQNKQFDRDRSY